MWYQPTFEKSNDGGQFGCLPECDQEMQVVRHEDGTSQRQSLLGFQSTQFLQTKLADFAFSEGRRRPLQANGEEIIGAR